MPDDASLTSKFAHDVRTYLRTVLTRIQLVQYSAAAHLPQEDQAMLQEAAGAARDIDRLLSAMTAYWEGQGEEGTTNLSLLLRGLLLENKAMLAAVDAKVEVANELDAAVPASLKSVLKELLANACRFGHNGPGTQIVIASRMGPEGEPGNLPARLEIAVSDNGPGVDAAYLEKIFAPFFRLHSRDEFPGYGLGLATCRRIVAGWGGAISAERGAGDGLTVRVTVPVS